MSDKAKKDESNKLKFEIELTIKPVNPSDSKDKKTKKSSDSCLIVLVIPLLILCGLVLTLPSQSPVPAGAQVGSASSSIQPIVPVVALPACEPGISAGNWARVAALPGVRLRSSPGYRNKDDGMDTIGYLGYGSQLQILSGPRIADGLCWWWVRDGSSGKEGWMADHAQGGQRRLKP